MSNLLTQGQRFRKGHRILEVGQELGFFQTIVPRFGRLDLPVQDKAYPLGSSSLFFRRRPRYPGRLA